MKKSILKSLQALALVLLFLTFSPGALAIEYGQLGGRPANPDSSIPNSDAWFIYNLVPGDTKEDAVQVMNPSDSPVGALVYAADSLKSAGGGFAVRQFSEPKQDVGAWVRFYPDSHPESANKIFSEGKKINEVCILDSETLTGKYHLDDAAVGQLKTWCQGTDHVELQLKPQDKINVPFVISIPRGIDVGEHTGGVMIQKESKDAVTQENGSNVMLVTRVGVRIYETVPGEVIKKLSFSNLQISKNYKEFFWPWDRNAREKFRSYVIGSQIENDGNASADLHEKIIIKNLFLAGNSANQEINRDFQLLRGDNFNANFEWKAPFFGYVSFQKEYTYLDGKGNEQKNSSAVVKKLFLPLREIAFSLLLLIVLALAYIFWKKYLERKYGGQGWVLYKIKKGDTLANLAGKCSTNWKILAKTNKLKPPYIITPGETLLVPLGSKLKTAKIRSGQSKKEAALRSETSCHVGKRLKDRIHSSVRYCRANNCIILRSKIFWIILAVILILIAALDIAGIFNRKNHTSGPSISSMASGNSSNANSPAGEKNPTDSQGTKPASPAKDKTTLEVRVLNEGAAPGSAAKIKKILDTAGYNQVAAQNGENVGATAIAVFYSDSSQKEAASEIKGILEKNNLSVDVKTAGTPEEQSADVVIVAGQ